MNAWGCSAVSTGDFIFISLELDNIVSEMKMAKKVVDDLSNLAQLKQLEGGLSRKVDANSFYIGHVCVMPVFI